jgi:Tol biopolymer transport system component
VLEPVRVSGGIYGRGLPGARFALIGGRVTRRLRLPTASAASFVALALAGLTGVAYAAIAEVPGTAEGANTIAQTIRAGDLQVTGSFLLVPTAGAGPNGTANHPLGGFPTDGSSFAILTTGSASLAGEPNTRGDSGVSLAGGPRTAGGSDRDVTILKIDFTAPAGANCVGFDFKFLSEEFPEFVGRQFNDAFIAELDDSTWSTEGSVITAPNNFAFDPAGNPISVNATGTTSFSAANAEGTTYDGATAVLRASTQVTPGAHSLFLSIFDQGDHIYDSAVFVDNLVVGSVPNPETQCVEGARGATIELATQQPTVIGGAQSVPVSQISLSELTAPGAGTTRSTPIDGIPIDGIDLAASPIDGIPIDGIGLTPDLLNEVLGGVHLSDLPISTPGGWDALLANTALAGVPLQTVTLADVLALQNSPAQNLTLGQMDLSATPIDGIPLAGLALGPLLLSEIPLNADPPNDEATNLAEWCAEMNQEPGYACPNAQSLQGETLIAATLRGLPIDGIPIDGIPIDGIPIDGIPIDGIDLTGTPIDGIPIDGIDLTGTPIDGIPIDGIDFAVSPIDGIPIDGIDILGSAFGAIPIDGISATTRDQVVDCTSPGFVCAGKTLRDAKVAGRLRQGATLGLLDGALGNITLGQLVDALLGSFGFSLADLVTGLPEPPERTLHDVLAVLLGAAAYDWSDLDLNSFPIAKHSPDGGVITYEATFKVAGGLSPTAATIHATLPDGGLYKDGSATLVEKTSATAIDVDEPTLAASGLEWTAEVDVDTEYVLTWRVHAPIELGRYTVSADITVGENVVASSEPASVEVAQTLEPNNTPGAGPELQANTLYLSYMLQGDVDRYVVPIPQEYGSRVKITLSHIAEGTDLDLTVAGPPAAALRAAPGNAIPLQNSQLPDTEVELDQRSQPLAPETLQDVPTDAITTGANVVRATSDNRGNADEEVTLLSQGEQGNYIVQVSDFEGDSPMPYMLEVAVSAAPNLGTCDPRLPSSFPHFPDGVAGAVPTTIPANVNTLILVNRKRLGDTYGAGAMNDVMAKLNELAGRADLGIVGAVVPVEGDSAVADAYGDWDQNPCSPAAANEVVRQIGQLIDRIEPANLRYKVIVGGDDQIPFGRVPDETLIANESTYVQSLGGPNNQYKGAFGHGFLMTDDVYAEKAAPQLFGHELFVPDQAIGRVLETPAEIVGLIDAFLGRGGAFAPQSSLVTGYDFLTDGSKAVNAPFAADFGANAKTLISETWVAKDPASGDVFDDLEDALFPATGAPQLNSINAHFDHTRLLPAAENAAHRATNLYESDDIRSRGAAAVAERLFFSMGCHSGLSISDVIYGAGDPLAKDWAQTFLGGGAFGWIGNTGYGLGDTVEVAYTERLHALFTGNLDGSLTLGEALAQAKQEYLSQLAIVGGYDAKVVMQATLFGLPMLKIGSGPAAKDPPPLPTQTDPATGLPAASFNESVQFTPVETDEGKFYRAETTQATNRRPIEPAVTFDVTQPGKVAHGIVITSLNSNAPDEQPFDAAFSRVVTDDSDDEPELVGEASHPAKIPSLSTFKSFTSPTGIRQNAVLIAGLYRSDGVPDPEGIGIHRLYDQIGGYVLYADPGETDFTPPELGAFEAQTIANGAAFAVDVTDADGTVEDVKVIYRDCSGTWRLATLQPSGTNRWSGGGPVAANCNEIDYYLQAVDDAGNVAVSSRKVTIASLELPDPTGATPINIQPTGTQVNGWYTGAVAVTITPSTGMEYSLDGGAFQAYTGQFSVVGDGVHSLKAKSSDGSTKTAGFAIDTTNPTVVMTTPAPGAALVLGSTVLADYACADAGSGAQSCTGTVASGQPLETSSVGTKTISVTATDAVGRSFTLTRTYDVIYRDILFSSSRTGHGDIYALGGSGGTPAQLTTHPGIDAEPAWSPDRKQIAFTSTRDGNVELYVLDVATGDVTRLTTHGAVDTSPAFSPDGSQIAFASNRGSGGNWDIYVIGPGGGSATRLTTNSASDVLPAWSPDGTQLAFMSTRTANGDIYRLSLASPATTQVRLTSGSSASGVDTEPAWHGTRIAFSTNRHGSSNFELYALNTATGAQTRLTNQSGHQITPSWSRDGKRIAFMSSSSGNGDIYVATVPNPLAVIPVAAQTRLTSHAAIDALPDW